jgi:hypothetical protein
MRTSWSLLASEMGIRVFDREYLLLEGKERLWETLRRVRGYWHRKESTGTVQRLSQVRIITILSYLLPKDHHDHLHTHYDRHH